MGVRKQALNQAISSMNKLLTSADPPGKFRKIFDHPVGLFQTLELPVAYVVPGVDTGHRLVGVPGTDEEVEGTIAITILAGVDDEGAAKDLVDLVFDVTDRFKTDIPDFRALSPAVYLTGLPIIGEPTISDDGRFAFARLQVRYHN